MSTRNFHSKLLLQRMEVNGSKTDPFYKNSLIKLTKSAVYLQYRSLLVLSNIVAVMVFFEGQFFTHIYRKGEELGYQCTVKLIYNLNIESKNPVRRI